MYFFLVGNRKHTLKGVLYYLKIIAIIAGTIIALSYIVEIVVSYFAYNSIFSTGIAKYHDPNVSRTFFAMDYMQPLHMMLLAYIVLCRKHLHDYEVYILMLFVILNTMQYITNDIAALYTRAGLVPAIGIILISVQILKRFNPIYSVIFVGIIFVSRMFTYIVDDLGFPFINIAKGDFLSPNYGLISSILFYNPSFSGF